MSGTDMVLVVVIGTAILCAVFWVFAYSFALAVRESR